MAIDFKEKENSNPNLSKTIVLAVVLIFGIVCFVFLKNNGFGSNEDMIQSGQMFQPINIDFNFISGKEFKNLENFRGIPVLPGFFDASDTKTEAEKIEPGRENPFASVSSKEIELAVTKVIQRINTIEEINEMRKVIQDSTLYTASQKNSLLLKLNEQKEILERLLNGDEPENNNEDVAPQDKTPVEKDNQDIDYYKEW